MMVVAKEDLPFELTAGKVYKVESQFFRSYFLQADNGIKVWLSQERFTHLEEVRLNKIDELLKD